MSPDQVRKAKAMLLDPYVTEGEVARHFKVTRMTLNKALASGEQKWRATWAKLAFRGSAHMTAQSRLTENELDAP